MKKIGISLFLLAVLFQGCSSLQLTSVNKEKTLRIREKVEAFDFTFEALNARSMRFNQIHLSSGYTLKVSKDTLTAYLPFYGRAYTAPMNSTDGGIKFTSTTFEHQLVVGKKPGHWKITFKTLDTRNPITLYLDVWDNGSAHLSVNDPDRQSMNFDGNIL